MLWIFFLFLASIPCTSLTYMLLALGERGVQAWEVHTVTYCDDVLPTVGAFPKKKNNKKGEGGDNRMLNLDCLDAWIRLQLFCIYLSSLVYLARKGPVHNDQRDGQILYDCENSRHSAVSFWHRIDLPEINASYGITLLPPLILT